MPVRLTKQDKLEIEKKWQKCWRKRKYTLADAENVLFRMKYQNKPGSGRLHVYSCEYCGKHHIGGRR